MTAERENAPGVAREMLVDVADHAERIADIGDPDPLASELRFDKQPDREREGRRDEQFSERVGLVVGSSAPGKQPVRAGPQGVGVLAILEEEPVTALAQQPGQDLLQDVAAQGLLPDHVPAFLALGCPPHSGGMHPESVQRHQRRPSPVTYRHE